ncbi:MAG: GNAT family N-acetyltransferase [Sedimentisphaerales bacterium]|nr:GNAT family N-acetyltransferase [Sedimentisphaerales bacterium]
MPKDDGVRIRELHRVAGDVDAAASVLRRAFATVAERFALTEENCPRSPAFATSERVVEEMERGVRYYLFQAEAQTCGCVALEHAKPEVVYLERLGVVPERRARGYGSTLVRHVLTEAKTLGARRVEIGIIAEDTPLQSWYERFGFEQTKTKRFDHLPFLVGFLAKEL